MRSCVIQSMCSFIHLWKQVNDHNGIYNVSDCLRDKAKQIIYILLDELTIT